MSAERHDDACVEARGGADRWPDFLALTPERRAAVVACPHWSHDTVRLVFAGREGK